jgi:hypothetical protein
MSFAVKQEPPTDTLCRPIGHRRVPTLLSILVVLLSSATLVAGQNPPSSGDSDKPLGDIARKVRPKDAKITSQRVFTDDDVKHGDPIKQSETESSAAPPKSSAVDDAERTLNETASKTSEELGFQCYGLRSWPEKTLWEQRLYASQQKSVDATKVWIDMMRRGEVSGVAHDKALADMEVAQIGFNETKSGCIVAVHAWDKEQAWRASHAGN